MNPIDNDPQSYYEKRLLVLRSTLLALQWYKSLACLEFGLGYHKGFRKDNRTPEFLHQVEQSLFALTLRHLLVCPEDTVCAILLHDTLEDYYEDGVRLESIREVGGERVAVAVELLTNHVDKVKKPADVYYGQMSHNVIASFAKACDRMNNQSTMAGVFSADKMRFKIDETLLHVMPMLKLARRLFPQQEDAYQNVKTILEQQVRLLEHIVIGLA